MDPNPPYRGPPQTQNGDEKASNEEDEIGQGLRFGMHGGSAPEERRIYYGSVSSSSSGDTNGEPPDRIAETLERIATQIDAERAEAREFREAEESYERRMQEEEKKQIARGKRRFIVQVQKRTKEYKYFQDTRNVWLGFNNSNDEANEPKTPDPDGEWTRRQLERAMKEWKSRLKQ